MFRIILFVFLVAVTRGLVPSGNGGCTFESGAFQADLFAGSNGLFYYVDKLNQAPTYNTNNGIVFYDSLINPPTEGYQYAGTPGANITVALHEDTTTYITFATQHRDLGQFLFSSAVLYWGLGLKGLYTPTPSSFSFSVYAISSEVGYQTAVTACSIDSNSYISCVARPSNFGPGFNVSTVSSVIFTIYPSCSVSCPNNGYMQCISSTQFQTCSNGIWATPQSCQTGTYCNQNGNYIYCGYTPSVSSSSSTSTTAPVTSAAAPITSGAAPITSGAPQSLTTLSNSNSGSCTIGNTRCSGASTYQTCVYTYSTGGYIGAWGANQNCASGTSCVQYNGYIGCN